MRLMSSRGGITLSFLLTVQRASYVIGDGVLLYSGALYVYGCYE